MNKSNLLKLLDEINIHDSPKEQINKHEKILLIDGLNLFMRNFTVINHINKSGNHIGGVSGFLRSLGSLIRITQPTSVYMIFDGLGSSQNRKNLLPEYKSGRNVNRITNWDHFQNLEDENTSKVSQIVRLAHYLKCLPVKTLSIDKVEADDVIAYYSEYFAKKHNSTIIIVSNDNDFIQLVNNNVLVYRPAEKIFYDPQTVKDKFRLHPENFIIYKTLLGDNSDMVKGVKGLGAKGLYKKFPELSERQISLNEIYEICLKKHKEHVVYSRIAFGFEDIKRNYKIMDLQNPIIDENEKEYLELMAEIEVPLLDKNNFKKLYNDDGLDNSIRNLDEWINEIFTDLKNAI